MTAQKPRHILVPIDLSEPSRAGLTAGLAVADRFGAKLTVVNVDTGAHSLRESITTFGAFVDGNSALERRHDERLDATRQFVRDHLGADEFEAIDVRVIEHGGAAETICRIADEEDFDWICMAAAGRRGWRRLFLGSTAGEVVRNSRVPVLTLRDKTEGEGDIVFFDLRRVLVATDLGDHAGELVKTASALAGKQGQLVLMHVIETPSDYGLYGAPVIAPAEDVNAAKEWSLAALEKLAAVIEGPGREPPQVRVGRTAECLLDAEQELDPDLIVLGTHGRHGLERWTLGSVAEAVVRHARGPVLVVPNPAGKQS
ncbi:MAG: universal stress protein [Planctomycetota bacterium]|nr:universal stress protein [Planctomycetota bacterium]